MRRKGSKRVAAAVDDLLRTHAGRRGYEEELLLGAVRSELLSELDRRGMTRRDLAQRLDVSLGRISQILSGADNMTLKTLAGVGLALDLRWDIRAQPAADAENVIDGQDDDDEDPIAFPGPEVQVFLNRPLQTPAPSAPARPEPKLRVSALCPKR